MNTRKTIPVLVIGLLATVAFILSAASSSNEAEANYVLHGASWQSSTANYRVNTNFPASAGTSAQVLTAIQNGASNWTTQACINFSFNYLGSTTITTNANDGTNAVFYTSSTSGSALATAFWWTNGGGANFSAFDIVYWNRNWDAVNPSGSEYDIEGIGTHEFGHALGLSHDTCNSQATMWASVGTGASGVSRRTLEPTDIAGAQALYAQGCVTPDPMSFATTPTLFSTFDNILTMTATTASAGGSAVQYKYDLTFAGGTGASSSIWQSSTYLDAGLQTPNVPYTYTVKARSTSTLVETQASAPATGYTAANVPGTPTFGNPTNSTIDIQSIDGGGNPATTFFAIEIDGLYVKFGGGQQAAPFWLPAATWSTVVPVITGLLPDHDYQIRVKARNGNAVETAFSPTVQVTTELFGPCAAGNVGVGAGGPYDTLEISGSTGGSARTVNLNVNDPITIEMTTPPTNASPANHAIFAWIGIPGAEYEYALPAFIGTLCFTPNFVNPTLPAFTIASSFGLGVEVFPGGTTTPYTSPATAIPFPLPPAVFQGVVEETPGVFRVTNLVQLRYGL